MIYFISKTFKFNYLKYIILIIPVYMFMPALTYAQLPEDFMSDKYIRVAETGELADSINVWGDVGSPGRYLVPEGTNLPNLIAFSNGYTQMRGSGQNTDWAKMLIEVKVSRYDRSRRLVEVAFFRYRFHDPAPVEMFEFDLHNNDIVVLKVRQRPSFKDYVGIVAPVVGVIATSFLLLENLRGN